MRLAAPVTGEAVLDPTLGSGAARAGVGVGDGATAEASPVGCVGGVAISRVVAEVTESAEDVVAGAGDGVPSAPMAEERDGFILRSAAWAAASRGVDGPSLLDADPFADVLGSVEVLGCDGVVGVGAAGAACATGGAGGCGTTGTAAGCAGGIICGGRS